MNKCDCEKKSCPKGCDKNHTHKGFFCEVCEPEAVVRMYDTTSWEDEYVELYGYLDKYVEGIVGRQGKWIASLLTKQEKTLKAQFHTDLYKLVSIMNGNPDYFKELNNLITKYK